ncbi:MAG: hypothetical protein KFF68_13650 [Desulfosarcina sp.]|nr:hypothetical protein [Desulfosarcina sp.]
MKPTIAEIPLPAAASTDSPKRFNFERAGFDAAGFMPIAFRRDAIPPSGVKTREVGLATFYRQPVVLSRKNP